MHTFIMCRISRARSLFCGVRVTWRGVAWRVGCRVYTHVWLRVCGCLAACLLCVGPHMWGSPGVVYFGAAPAPVAPMAAALSMAIDDVVLPVCAGVRPCCPPPPIMGDERHTGTHKAGRE